MERFCGVGILGFNSPEWLFSSVGAIFAGGLSSGIYSTSSADTVQYLGSHAPYHVFCVENLEELKRVTAGKTVKEAFPEVKK